MSSKPIREIDPRLVKAVGHPLRIEILETFLAGIELSAAQVSRSLGQRHATVCYHVGILQDCGAIEAAEGRRVPGTLDPFYRPVGPIRDFFEIAKAAFKV